MIDFIEYIVSELKSKRLSKADSLALIKQFSANLSATANASVIHPLLHSNTSDFSRQSYSTTFSGEEFFLTDHQVNMRGQPGRKVLPAVAYLEMARVAVEQAAPSQAQSSVLALHDITWTQPIVVTEPKSVTLALSMNDAQERFGRQINYEIYSTEAEQEIVHCHGKASFSNTPVAASLHIGKLQDQMQRGSLNPDGIYAAFTGMGFSYGPAHRGITAVYRGEGQLLAHLGLPAAAELDRGDYFLHPSLMDSALQAAVGLAVDLDQLPSRPLLPFALASLRIISACTPEMFAWVRYSQGSRPENKVIKADIDLCDEKGNICVQMRGLSSRALATEIGAGGGRKETQGALLATPVWHRGAPDAGQPATAGTTAGQHYIILCEMPAVKARQLEALIPNSHCLALAAQQPAIADRYSQYALGCFEQLQAILNSKPESKILVQIVIGDSREHEPFIGLAGLLKTACLENPHLAGQVILTEKQIAIERLCRQLQSSRQRPYETIIRYRQDSKYTLRWQIVETPADKARLAFKEQGVYLITGGLGGLGRLFAGEILRRTGAARVILTGRGPLSGDRRALLDQLSAPAGRLAYRQLDIGDPQQVGQLIDSLQQQYRQLNGILHCAGMIADNFILKKTAAECRRVLLPKVSGTVNLDRASRAIDLDFLVLFSAVAGALGNPGQADYAAANGFMDGFAAYRNRLAAAGQRRGRTLSINWPLWQAGGMAMAPASWEALQQSTGMQPLQTATGMQAFYRSLEMHADQSLVMEGYLPQIRRLLLSDQRVQAAAVETEKRADSEIDLENLTEKTRAYLNRQLSELLKVPSQQIDSQAPLEQYGIDSILAMNLTAQLEKAFGSLPKTLFFEYQTIGELADYFVEAHPAQLSTLLATPGSGQVATPAPAPATVSRSLLGRRFQRPAPQPPAAPAAEPIAIIGLSGRYPQAGDIEAYWHNLRSGRDCIVEVPETRWDWRQYYSEDRSESGRHYSKWGGFIDGVDEFDPLFFNISPREAESLDPQERLFLQHAWMAVEDAGYTRSRLQLPDRQGLAGQVGVYVGVMYGEYQLSGNLASIANRVSYVLNLHGPSMAVDTMCSSSLTAIHLACQDLKQGRTSLAIAGGVNLSIHPNKYLMLSAGQFISSAGHCQSFGDGGDGYIPGEGVGVVVLQRLSEAVREGQQIYAVITGSALNHGGKTNGYTVPNPQAQADAIGRALAEAHTDPRHISYIEAHGTGTKLGDPIEIAALSKAFQGAGEEKGFCAIGSAKSNIGHCESAAGIAGLTKVLLQMRHRQLVPSLHSARLNPHIDFAGTPFVVNQTLRAWENPVYEGQRLARIAGISSFGAGGANAHMIVEEYRAPAAAVVQRQAPGTAQTETIVPLSARTAEQLRQKVRDLLAFLEREIERESAAAAAEGQAPGGVPDLASLAYTLQVGREAMAQRLGVIVNSIAQLVEKLRAYLRGEGDGEGIYQGQVKDNNATLSLFNADRDLRHTVAQWVAAGKLSRLADLWVSGVQLDWPSLYGEQRPGLISLPGYPFARERYWLAPAAGVAADAGAVAARLHPLLHSNTSDLSQQRYSCRFSGEEFFLRDHRLRGEGGALQAVLPAVAYLEMARAAVVQALPAAAEESAALALELRHIAWVQPFVVTEQKQLNITLAVNDTETIDYKIYATAASEESVYCQGQIALSTRAVAGRLDIDQLKAQMRPDDLDIRHLYDTLAKTGIHYGPTLRGVTAVYRGDDQLLASLSLPAAAGSSTGDYILHPSLMDAALQASVALAEDLTRLPAQPSIPFALDSLCTVSACAENMFAWVRYAPGSRAESKLIKVDIDLCDQQGNICVRMQGFSSRLAAADMPAQGRQGSTVGVLFATPVWQASAAATLAEAERPKYLEAATRRRHIMLCDMPHIEPEQFKSLIPDSHCVAVQAVRQKNIAERYCEYALACFSLIQGILADKSNDDVLIQIVVGKSRENALLSGLSGLLKTVNLENPRVTAQLMLTSPKISVAQLERQLQDNQARSHDAMVSYDRDSRYVLRWQIMPAVQEKPKVFFKDQGVYLVTGGFGGLGLLFAREILQQTTKARIILTGRAKLDNEKRAILAQLPADPDQLEYRQLDLDSPGKVEQGIAAVKKEYRQLNGILHCAGMILDNFILKKSATEFGRVLAPKVGGTVNLDYASKDIDLDFLVLFSSIAAAMGNPGQADYAAANGFMDQFAAYRNQMVSAGERRGITLSINWPLWQAGGMGLAQESLAVLEQTTGMQPMQTASGMQAFYRSLECRCDQILVSEGNLRKMRSALLADGSKQAVAKRREERVAGKVSTDILTALMRKYLSEQLSGLLKLAPRKIDPLAPLEEYGIDSVVAMKLINLLEPVFGSLSKTLLFEYQTIAGLAEYFVRAYPAVIQEKIGSGDKAPGSREIPQTIPPRDSAIQRGFLPKRIFAAPAAIRQDVAIVGLSGKYPLANNLDEFWENLVAGRDCITEIPAQRWDYKRYYDTDKNQLGKSYSKWGGFIEDVDKFDPLFFNISPKEAELIDPQERLFIETVWQAVEDAGYSKQSMAANKVGVFVGVMWGQYELFGAEAMLRENAAVPNSSYASIANRVSYFFDFHGPSLAIDTMCSSSLTAIHMASEDIRRGEVDVAIAGGVNVSIHPHKYLSLSQGKFQASDGRCRSFGKGGDGYVSGEGVGAIVLKSLKHAVVDGDHIYALIKSSNINHGGKTNGYSVPNPNAQADLILEAYRKADIDPKTLGYLETHGTGTSLGDPIEITGLIKAFEGFAPKKQFCPIGSVKSNIGHLEAAAGIASITKVLLQLKNRQLVPSLHADPLNPNINFSESPFYVQTQLKEWKRMDGLPRRVGISAFGAGGANAHLVLEEFVKTAERENGGEPEIPQVFILSAKNDSSLLRYAEKFDEFIGDDSGISFADMIYTLQVGRTPMDARLAIVAKNMHVLKDKLGQWLALRKDGSRLLKDKPTDELEDVFCGNTRDAQSIASVFADGDAGKVFQQAILQHRDMEKVAKLWTSGIEIDWPALYRDSDPRRISLPTYPFARERYWIVPEKSLSPVNQMRLAEREAGPLQENIEEKKSVYYTPVWRVATLASPAEMPVGQGSMLVLDATDELFLALKSQLKNHREKNAAIWVKPGDSYRQTGSNAFAINPSREKDFKRLLEQLRARDQLPYQIVYQCPQTGDQKTGRHMTRQLDESIYTLFYLCKALMTYKTMAAVKILCIFASKNSETVPQNAALGGFCKTLAMENPKYLAKVVEIPSSLENADSYLSRKADLILHELRDNTDNAKDIRYQAAGAGRDLSRYTRAFIPFLPAANISRDMPIKQGGVYLVSGGLGGLGFTFSEYLAKEFQANLILLGRSPLQAERERKINQLKAHNIDVLYLQADVSKFKDVQAAVFTAKARFSRINGIIHSAGVTRDSFILRKTKAEVDAVLSPKIHGALNLDLATADERLDLFVLFSSIAGVTGNAGQSDYAYSNHFLDSFAENREYLRREKRRYGRAISINWPFWKDGGMDISENDIVLTEKQTGVYPLPTREGIRCWENLLRSDISQGIPLYGIPSRIEAYIEKQIRYTGARLPEPVETIEPSILLEKTQIYLKQLLSEEIKLAPDRIDSRERFESFGIDSVMINRFNANLENDLVALPKTLLYEYETVEELAGYLVREAQQPLLLFFKMKNAIEDLDHSPANSSDDTVQTEAVKEELTEEGEAIAIIGIHAYYPHSRNLDEYWENLKQGRDLIDQVPPTRWDYEKFYDADPERAGDGKIYGKWGGFLEDFDKFDPQFFNISAAEARIIDPQERLFLQSVWAAIEDAGYTRESLKRNSSNTRSANVGVFAGVTTNSYHLLAPEEWARGNMVSPSALPWSIANRVSYFFDFQGPSMPVDTACSSSLVAIHLACESLKNRECQIAIAGGVNLYLHPAKYHSLCQRRMLSQTGKCHSFGAGDDGFVPGEGVGSLLLKPAGRAIEDRDHIYALVPASAVDHSGRSNGYTAPNPNAQAGLIERALAKAGIHPESISYVEGHGTGTQLGDSLEIAALSKAFQKHTTRKQFCSLGSVKANMGHAESAAGVAGLSKILLQMKHRQLVPTLYADEVNPNIDFDSSPFYLQRELAAWKSSPGYPRRALINSFGAGGVNACVVLEAFEKPDIPQNPPQAGPYLLVLSARDSHRLREYVKHLLVYLACEQTAKLADLAYTLQVGREAMQERLALVVSETGELVDRLRSWSAGKAVSGIYRGHCEPRRNSKDRPAHQPKDPQGEVSQNQYLSELATLWVEGGEVDWEKLYCQSRPMRIPLPTYPFARQRYWVTDTFVEEKATVFEPLSPQLHPLISYNSSTLKQVSFSSLLSDREFYARDHRVKGERILPGSGFLEIACMAGNLAGENRVCKIKDIVWIQPLSFRDGPQMVKTVLRPSLRSTEYEIFSLDQNNEKVVHSEGKLYFQKPLTAVVDTEKAVSLESLKEGYSAPGPGADYYTVFSKYGLDYGPGFQTIEAFYSGESSALSKLRIAESLKADFDQFIFHPSIIDGALQTIAGLIGNTETATPYLPFAVDEVEIFRPIPPSCYAYVEFAGGADDSHRQIKKFNIKILNEKGNIAVILRRFYVRAFNGTPEVRYEAASGLELVDS